jgi:predicted alpha/beta superfamily hydrolase
MKKINWSLLALILTLPLLAAAVDTQYMQGIGDTRYHRIESEIIGRGFYIYIMLPDGYDEDGASAYPTIYLLDGGSLFPLLVGYYRYLNFSEEVPDSIIVGISYGGDSIEEGNYRSTDYTAPAEDRDYWGGAANYQSFLSDELIPLIEKNYRSDAERRIIFGHSIGGQFVLFTALTKPEIFWGHIASNPAETIRKLGNTRRSTVSRTGSGMDPTLERQDQKAVETEDDGSGKPHPHVGTARGLPARYVMVVL